MKNARNLKNYSRKPQKTFGMSAPTVLYCLLRRHIPHVFEVPASQEIRAIFEKTICKQLFFKIALIP